MCPCHDAVTNPVSAVHVVVVTGAFNVTANHDTQASSQAAPMAAVTAREGEAEQSAPFVVVMTPGCNGSVPHVEAVQGCKVSSAYSPAMSLRW